MTRCKYCESNFERHYSLRPNNFWTGFFFFFGGNRSTYAKALREIRHMDEGRALCRDIRNIQEDTSYIIRRENLKIEKQLMDACQ